jgi:hypothetical protein
MAYQVTVDYDVPLADYSPTFESLEDRVAAALATLTDTDSLPDAIDVMDQALSRSIFVGDRMASDNDLSQPGVIAHIGALLTEYDRTVVKSAAQLRTYITNRLILETDNADPRVRLRALEMLGKVSDVGLFTDKTEITMRHRPTEELEQLLRERLTRVIEAEVVAPAPAETQKSTPIDFSELETDDGPAQ